MLMPSRRWREIRQRYSASTYFICFYIYTIYHMECVRDAFKSFVPTFLSFTMTFFMVPTPVSTSMMSPKLPEVARLTVPSTNCCSCRCRQHHGGAQPFAFARLRKEGTKERRRRHGARPGGLERLFLSAHQPRGLSGRRGDSNRCRRPLCRRSPAPRARLGHVALALARCRSARAGFVCGVEFAADGSAE
jgi:hypothetical protein